MDREKRKRGERQGREMRNYFSCLLSLFPSWATEPFTENMPIENIAVNIKYVQFWYFTLDSYSHSQNKQERALLYIITTYFVLTIKK